MGERPYLMDYRKTEDLISNRLVMAADIGTAAQSALDTTTAVCEVHMAMNGTLFVSAFNDPLWTGYMTAKSAREYCVERDRAKLEIWLEEAKWD